MMILCVVVVIFFLGYIKIDHFSIKEADHFSIEEADHFSSPSLGDNFEL